MKFSKIALSIFVAVIAARALFYSISDGFSSKRIEFPPIEHTPSAPPSPGTLSLLQNVFKEPFHYLAKGSQAYAFESADGQHILKLFKCHHWNDGSWAENLPLPEYPQQWFNSLVKRRRVKVSNTRNSFQIVKEYLSDECGILYIQDSPSRIYDLTLLIVDRAKRRYSLNASKIGFALQMKATLIFPTLDKWAAHGEIEKVRNGIESLVALMYRRCQKGIYDSDPDIHKNAGFIGTKAIHIDIGSFQIKEQLKERNAALYDIQKCLQPLSSWLQTHIPDLEDFYRAALAHPETCVWSNDKI